MNESHPREDELNDYADAEPSARAANVGAHVAQCEQCAATIAGLTSLRADAASLSREIAPPIDLWPAIAQRTVLAPARSRSAALHTLRMPLAAAALLLIVASSVTTWLLTRSPVAAPVAAASADTPAGAASLVAFAPSDLVYRQAIAELEKALVDQRAQLDSLTVRVVTENLATIDSALATAQAALAADPSNTRWPAILAGTYRKKIELLEHTLRITKAS